MEQRGLTIIEEKRELIRSPETHRLVKKIFGEDLADEFAIAAKVAIDKTPKLANCSKESFLAAYIGCAQMGLMPNTPGGEAYLIPYGRDCTLVMGYKGLVKLAYNSGMVLDVQFGMYHENDTLEFTQGTEVRFKFSQALGDRGERKGAWALIRLKTGGVIPKYMNEEEILSHRPANRSGSPWNSKNVYDQNAMWMKTAIIQAMKTAPKSKEMQAAIMAEEHHERGVVATMKTVDSQVEYKETNQAALGFADTMPEPVQAEAEVLTPEPVKDSGPPEKTQEWRDHFWQMVVWMPNVDHLQKDVAKDFDTAWKKDGFDAIGLFLGLDAEHLAAERLGS